MFVCRHAEALEQSRILLHILLEGFTHQANFSPIQAGFSLPQPLKGIMTDELWQNNIICAFVRHANRWFPCGIKSSPCAWRDVRVDELVCHLKIFFGVFDE